MTEKIDTSKWPDALLDNEGYPTEEYLKFIREYNPCVMPIMNFVEGILQDGWYMSDWGFVLRKAYKGKRKLELHTGGWSGNEDTIQAILSNHWLTYNTMKYVQWRTGGHYYFEINLKD